MRVILSGDMDSPRDSAWTPEAARAETDTPRDLVVQRPGRDGAHIPAWYILAGLSKLRRHEVCDMLALFECFSVRNKILDRCRDWRDRRREGGSSQPAFEKRVREKSEQ